MADKTISNRDDNNNKNRKKEMHMIGNGFIRNWLWLESNCRSHPCTCSEETKENNQKLKRPQVCPQTGLTRATESCLSAFCL